MAGDAGTAMTPDGLAIYSTTGKSAGTPITRVSIVKKRIEPGTGAEPVCLFSGGDAVDFKHKWGDNFGLNILTYGVLADREHKFTAQDDLEDGYYIYFWPKDQYKASGEGEAAPYISGFSYFLSADSGNEEYMQKFAAANGFELVMDGNSPATMMAEGPAKMNPIACWHDVEGGALGHDWRYDLFHFLYGGAYFVFSDGAIYSNPSIQTALDNEDCYTTMYFGVSNTYNPYRAITGVAGLIVPYTETTASIRYSGLPSPAGTMLACNVSIQGIPTTGPGIAYGYFSYANMTNSLYVNLHTKQYSDLPWLSGGGRTGAVSATQNVYQKKQYVAAVVVGSGKTTEQAITNLYQRMASMWPSLASQFPDISETPLVSEFDEILPIDIDDETPCYEEYVRDTTHVDPKDNQWVYGNDAANRRWGHTKVGKQSSANQYYVSDKTADKVESTDNCAYIGVIRRIRSRLTAT